MVKVLKDLVINIIFKSLALLCIAGLFLSCLLVFLTGVFVVVFSWGKYNEITHTFELSIFGKRIGS